jgi:hypothetical protein
MNGTIFLISFSACLLLVYRKDTDFCILILYTATLLKLFIRPKNFKNQTNATLIMNSSLDSISVGRRILVGRLIPGLTLKSYYTSSKSFSKTNI